MIEDVTTGDPTRLLCLNCARRVASPQFTSKYAGLTNHLKFRGSFTKLVKLSFARIDGLIGSNLPMDAYRDAAWWSNSATVAHAKAWLDAGWAVQEANLKEGYVLFKKVREVSFKGSIQKGKIKKPFTPVRVKSHRRKLPSKTKLSKLYARIKNLERQRTSRKTLRGL
ncbi:MAG: hypothetical protein QXU99_03260 [Candidatus Bathyarchaeia archaeon]